MLTEALTKYLQQRLASSLYRRRELNTTLDDGSHNFNSNDYLSLSYHPKVKQAFQYGFSHYPSGSAGSMMTCGYYPIHRAFERQFAEALGVDACVLFASGYAANLSVAALLGHLEPPLLVDKNAHASVYDGLKHLPSGFSRFLHNDLVDLKNKMETKPGVVMTEGLFSMSGQYAPLAAMAKQCQMMQWKLFVDEAHSFGIKGYEGLGAVVAHRLTPKDVPIRVIPLGKAHAGSGAIVAGDGTWIEALLQLARPMIYSTALSPAFTYGLLETFQLLRAAEDRRQKLDDLVSYFCQKVATTAQPWRDSVSPIQQLQLGCPDEALSLAAKLKVQGVFCTAIRQPTVTKPETGLRVILNYHHQPEDIDYLLMCIEKA